VSQPKPTLLTTKDVLVSGALTAAGWLVFIGLIIFSTYLSSDNPRYDLIDHPYSWYLWYVFVGGGTVGAFVIGAVIYPGLTITFGEKTTNPDQVGKGNPYR